MKDEPTLNDESADDEDDARSQASSAQVADAVEQYLRELESGQAPDREQFVARHPDIADELRKCLEGLQLLGSAIGARREAKGDGCAPTGAPADDSAARSAEPMPASIGDFRIVRRIGRGGMGTVYEAEQVSLRRRVALKVLPLAGLTDPQALGRFRVEVLAAAQLHHTNIVPVFATGCERGVHFYAMQYVEGQTLADVIRQLRRMAGLESGQAPPPRVTNLSDSLACDRWAALKPSLPPDEPAAAPDSLPASVNGLGREFFRSVAKLGIQAAEALEHAHLRGVVHRDIKPSNLMVDEEGRLWVTDFGLASFKYSTEATLTVTGAAIGTPRYMSPEQALVLRTPIDHRTDIYSLGVTLYELLTLQPAFDGENRGQILDRIGLAQFTPPRKLNPKLPRDLETIVLKAMSREPHERYATARELAEDLQRFLEDKPVQAKRPNLRQRGMKWCKRHKPLVWAAAVIVVLSGMGLMLSSYLLWRAEQRTTGALLQSERQRIEKQRLLAISQMDRGVRLLGDGDQTGLLDLATACDTARDLPDLRERTLRLWALAEAPWDGQLQAVLPRADHLVFSPDDRYAATCTANEVQLWDTADWQRRGVPLALDGPITGMAFSPDGRRFAAHADTGDCRLWDAESGQLVARLSRQASRTTTSPTTIPAQQGESRATLAFSPDGKLLAAGYDDGVAELWDLITMRRHGSIENPVYPLEEVCFSPDGSLLGMNRGGSLSLWQVANCQPSGESFYHKFGARSFFAIDGKYHIQGQDSLTLRPTNGGRPVELTPHDWVIGGAISADGRFLGTAEGGWVAEVWDLDRGKLAVAGLPHHGRARRIGFSPDGELVGTLSDGSLNLWHTTTGKIHSNNVLFAAAQNLAFSSTGTWLATTGARTTTRANALGRDHSQLWTQTRVWRLSAPNLLTIRCPGECVALAFSPDSRRVATACDRVVQIWELASGDPLGYPLVHPAAVDSILFMPNGSTVLTRDGEGNIRAWNPVDGQWLTPIIKGADPAQPAQAADACAGGPEGLLISRDGAMLAALSRSRHVQFWDLLTGAQLGKPVVASDAMALALSPDHTISADGAYSWYLTIRQVPGGEVLSKTFIWERAYDVRFRDDGAQMATASWSGHAQLWDVTNPRQPTLHACLPHPERVWRVAYSPDGRLLATSCADQRSPSIGMSVWLWDLSTGPPYYGLKLPPQVAEGWPEFSPDGKWLATYAGGTARVRLWRLPRIPKDSAEAKLATHVSLGGYRDGGERDVPVDGQQWARMRDQLQTIRGTACADPSPGVSDRSSRYAEALHQLDIAMRSSEQDRILKCGMSGLKHLTTVIAEDQTNLSYRRTEAALRLIVAGALAETGQLQRAIEQCQLAEAAFWASNQDRAPGAAREAALAGDAMELAARCRRAGDDDRADRLMYEAIVALERAMELQPTDTTFHSLRAEAYASRSITTGLHDWGPVAAHARKYIAQRPACDRGYYLLALAELAQGRLDGYRVACAAALEAYRDDDRGVFAWICALAPDATGSWQKPLAMTWAQRMLDCDEEESEWLDLGAIKYRAGEYGEAERILSTLMANVSSGKCTLVARSPAYAWCFLSMCNQRLGKTTEARACLVKAIEVADRELRENAATTWDRRLILELLLKEARDVVRPPTTVPAPGPATQSITALPGQAATQLLQVHSQTLRWAQV